MPAESVHLVPKLLLIAAGGAVGSVGRYLIGGWALALLHASTFPAGTMAVNVLGCAIIGVLGALFDSPQHLVREEYRFAIMIGVLGGFTTFSTFSLETLQLMNEGSFSRAAMNIILTNILCLGGAWIGYRVGERIFGQ